MFKRTIYITLFVFLGAMIGFLAHATAELFLIRQLLSDYDVWTAGLSWNQILFGHGLFVFVTTGLGAYLGYSQGVFWWRKIYVEKIIEHSVLGRLLGIKRVI